MLDESKSDAHCSFSENSCSEVFQFVPPGCQKDTSSFRSCTRTFGYKTWKKKTPVKDFGKKIMLSSPSHCHGILIAVKPVSALVKSWNCEPWASLSFHLWWDFDIFRLDTFNYFWQSHISLISISLTVMDVLSSVTVLGLFSCTQHCEAF